MLSHLTTRLNEPLHWFALYTRPKAEKYISSVLEKHGIETYCPTQKRVRSWSDRKKTIEEPVFRNYVFVRVDNSTQWSVKTIPGVINYVMADKKPAIIREEEMDVLRNFLDNYPKATILETAIVADQRVRITKGIFCDHEGIVSKVVGNYVKVYIHSLGLIIQATLPLHELQPADTNLKLISA